MGLTCCAGHLTKIWAWERGLGAAPAPLCQCCDLAGLKATIRSECKEVGEPHTVSILETTAWLENITDLWSTKWLFWFLTVVIKTFPVSNTKQSMVLVQVMNFHFKRGPSSCWFSSDIGLPSEAPASQGLLRASCVCTPLLQPRAAVLRASRVSFCLGEGAEQGGSRGPVTFLPFCLWVWCSKGKGLVPSPP